MNPTKVILLACGSFNPPTNMHLRMFEIARDHLHRMGQHVVLGGLISPVHDAYGKKDLECSTHRLQMTKLALQSTDWIRVSDWECKQETWSRTKQVLQHHQNQINAILHPSRNNEEDGWDGLLPECVRNGDADEVQIKLLCGADLLESFGTPGLWADEDIETIVGQYGLVVITRSKTNPLEFIYNSDLLTKHVRNIVIVTEWICNEVSSTKIRRALRRSESVKYLIPDKVMDYIYKNALYHSKPNKYKLTSLNNKVASSLTPSPSDIPMESPSPTNCTIICNNTLFSHQKYCDKQLTIDTVDNNNTNKVTVTNALNNKHPGQAVKIITENNGEHKIIKNKFKNNDTQVRKTVKLSRSFSNFTDLDQAKIGQKTGSQLKECKSCDENLIRFIFTKHGIQVISDIETIV